MIEKRYFWWNLIIFKDSIHTTYLFDQKLYVDGDI